MATATIDRKTQRLDEVQKNNQRVRELIGKGVTGARLTRAEEALEEAEARAAKSNSRQARRDSIQAEVFRDRALALTRAQQAKAQAAETRIRETKAPVAEFRYAGLLVRIHLDVPGVDQRFATHALDQAPKLIRVHFHAVVGHARATATGHDAPKPAAVSQLADLIRDQLRVAVRFKVVEITVAEAK